MIKLKKSGQYKITLMRDIFGRYLCRVWEGFNYYEGFNKNKFTAYREAFKKLKY
jgi:hypothetical protein